MNRLSKVFARPYGSTANHWMASFDPFTTPRHGTTILNVRKGNQSVLIGDGMVSQGTMIVKPDAKKIRRLNNDIIVGFAGSTADCLALMERLEMKLEEHPGQLLRSCVELAKNWRGDKYMRHLSAVLVVSDGKISLEVTGNGDVLETSDGVISVGSGGAYAKAAALALYDTDLTAREIGVKAMNIAASMCCHTNDNFVIEELTIDSSS